MTDAQPTTSGELASLAPRRRSGVVGLVVRVALAAGLVLGWVQLASMPLHGSLDDLIDDLARGDVTRVTLERPGVGASGHFGVLWEGEGRPGRASYFYDDGTVSGSGAVRDEALRIRSAAELSPEDVEIVEVDALQPGGTWLLHGTALLGTLLVLVVGPQPRLATRWAWFWLMYLAPPAALVFLVLEPVPLWRREANAGRKRLTGGWALLLALVSAEALQATWFGDLFA